MPAGLRCSQCGAELAPGARFCSSCGALQATRQEAARITVGATLERPHGRIVLDARLGAGGMGVVWRGWLFHAPGTPREHDPPFPVAVKVLRQSPHEGARARELFAREAAALARLSHPNIVRAFETFDHGDTTVIVLEWVDGDTLETVIARHVARARLSGGSALPGLPFARAWYYFQQLLGALASVHALGLVHRDVKPANVLVRRDGVVKLTDFGIVTEGGGAAATSAIPGTGAYMSPEQVLGHALAGRSDLYSAAIVLYEALSGRTPFPTEDRSEFAVRAAQLTDVPPPIRAFLPQAPPVLDALFARALAKAPADRFPDAVTFGEAFRTALGLPESPEWRAEVELAGLAPGAAAGEGAPSRRAATLRDAIVQGVRTLQMQGHGG
jgi:serine/threonine-protein kinase